MKFLKKRVVSLVLLLIAIFIFTISGIISFSDTHNVSAYLSQDEIDICTMTNTYLDGTKKGTVDYIGFLICIWYMDDD
jgi:uncharacterized membrane protein (GlpM family)